MIQDVVDLVKLDWDVCVYLVDWMGSSGRPRFRRANSPPCPMASSMSLLWFYFMSIWFWVHSVCIMYQKFSITTRHELDNKSATFSSTFVCYEEEKGWGLLILCIIDWCMEGRIRLDTALGSIFLAWHSTLLLIFFFNELKIDHFACAIFYSESR